MIETIASILDKKGHTIYSVPPYAVVSDAIAIMAKHLIAAVLVLRDGELIGIISAKDYATKVIHERNASRASSVQEIMTSPVVTVDLKGSVSECMAIMTRYRIRHLPVFDQGKLVGVVSMGDLVCAVIADQAFQIEQLTTSMGPK